LSAVQNSRLSFAKIPKVLDIPDLLIIQKDSFKWFIEEGLKEILDEISPIEVFFRILKSLFRRAIKNS
jgi:DNA-directed RNA polymerase beta subunit